jgi:hypothetical protein
VDREEEDRTDRNNREAGREEEDRTDRNNRMVLDSRSKDRNCTGREAACQEEACSFHSEVVACRAYRACCESLGGASPDWWNSDGKRAEEGRSCDRKAMLSELLRRCWHCWRHQLLHCWYLSLEHPLVSWGNWAANPSFQFVPL